MDPTLDCEQGHAVLLADAANPLEIVVCGDFVYFTDSYDKVSNDDHVRRIPLAGGPPQALVWGAGRGLAIDATHVYVGAADGRLVRVPKTGGAALALARTDLYASDIAVDDHHVYRVVRSKDGLLVRTPK